MAILNDKIVNINPVRPETAIIKKAVSLLKNRRLVVFPTETVYGIGALYGDEKAENKLYEAKGRGKDKPFSIHISNVNIIKEIGCQIDKRAETIMNKYWPGPVTIILSSKSSSGLKYGFRFTEHPVALSLIDYCGGALIASSANIHTHISPVTAFEAYRQLGDKVDLILDAGTTGYAKDSTVIDLSDENDIAVLREGAISKQEILKILKEVDN